MIVDKICNQQVLGCLIKNPHFLSQIDKYRLGVEDFSSRFEKYIFSAIVGLYRNGAEKIAPIDIDNYLNVDEAAHTTFIQQNGIEYLQDILDFCNIENFSYYYNKLKKLNLLRDFKKQGFDISEFYCEDLTNSKSDEINSKFEKLSMSEIIDAMKRKLLHLESSYVQNGDIQVESIATGIEDFINDLKETTEIGVSIQGHIYNQVISGAQSGTLTIRGAPSGVGKTRNAVMDACYLAFPIRYNSITKEWEQTGNCEHVLFIITEQTQKQIKKMILAYLTDINEDRFKYGDFTENEMKIINKAVQIINDFSENFILAKCPDPNIEIIKSIVRENVLIHNIQHVFYDYIFISNNLLSEFRGFALRDDEILLLFSTALKDLAVELNVSMFTSTQVNAKADDNKDIRNEATLAGGRATINKADNGAIMARPTKDEIEILEQGGIIAKYGKPNLVTDVFKVRSGRWTQVRIWSIVDLGRLKKKDLFITDSRLDPIDEFFETPEYVIERYGSEEKEKIKKYLEMLNNG